MKRIKTIINNLGVQYKTFFIGLLNLIKDIRFSEHKVENLSQVLSQICILTLNYNANLNLGLLRYRETGLIIQK